MVTSDQFISNVTINNITPRTENATGLLSPIMRAMGHLLYALAASSATIPLVTPEEIHDEVRSAAAHLDSTITAEASVLSDEAHQRILHIKTYATQAANDWTEWPEADRPRCLLALVNAFMSLTVFLDRELAGIQYYETDPGSAL